MAPHDDDSAVQDTPKTTRVTKRLAASKAKAALHKAAQVNLKTAVLTPPDSPDKLSATPKPRKRASPKAKRDVSPKLDAGDPPTKERKKPGRKPRAKTETASKRGGVKPARSAILRKTGAGGALKKKVAFSEAEDVSIEIEHSPSGSRSFCSIIIMHGGRKLHMLVVSLFLATVIGGLIAIKIGNEQKTAKRKSKAFSSVTDTASLKPFSGRNPDSCDGIPFSIVSVFVEIYGVDFQNSLLKLSNTFLPCGTFISDFDSMDSFLSQNISFSVDAQTITFPAGQIMTSKLNSVYLNGDVNNYPLDQFDAVFNIRGRFGPANSDLPIQVVVYGAPLGYSLAVVTTANTQNTAVSVSITLRRTAPILGFAFIIMGLMWVMSLLAVAVAYFTWFIKKDRRSELPYIIFSVTLLFAMPTIRNAMPNAPPIGVLADQMVTGWAMLLLSLSVISHFVNVLYHTYSDWLKAVAAAE
ncbi:hypothetical protein HDU80_006194 [Chytriomyces hyalinus]|nr:hypothetical protein HDU80_006194 [Chytriomyces hyalinus]